MQRLRPVRIVVITLLVLLFFQYELGMVVIMSDPEAIHPVTFSIANVFQALRGVGNVAVPHAILGGLLWVLALVNLILSLRSGIRSIQVLGVLSFLSFSFAATGGLFFVLSGFQNDHSSHNMATNFILSFALYFLELYLLKPNGQKT